MYNTFKPNIWNVDQKFKINTITSVSEDSMCAFSKPCIAKCFMWSIVFKSASSMSWRSSIWEKTSFCELIELEDTSFMVLKTSYIGGNELLFFSIKYLINFWSKTLFLEDPQNWFSYSLLGKSVFSKILS